MNPDQLRALADERCSKAPAGCPGPLKQLRTLPYENLGLLPRSITIERFVRISGGHFCAGRRSRPGRGHCQDSAAEEQGLAGDAGGAVRCQSPGAPQ